MADEVTIKYLYPPNFGGTYPAGTKNGARRYIILCTCQSDGTGEDDGLKVKRTDLLTPSGGVPSKLVIEKIQYEVSGMTVIVSYNNQDEDQVAVLTGSDEIDYTPYGGFVPASDDPLSGGDIVFTTENASLGDTYNIILTVRPK